MFFPGVTSGEFLNSTLVSVDGRMILLGKWVKCKQEDTKACRIVRPPSLSCPPPPPPVSTSVPRARLYHPEKGVRVFFKGPDGTMQICSRHGAQCYDPNNNLSSYSKVCLQSCKTNVSFHLWPHTVAQACQHVVLSHETDLQLCGYWSLDVCVLQGFVLLGSLLVLHVLYAVPGSKWHWVTLILINVI